MSSSTSKQFILFDKRIELPDFEKLSIYMCQYDITHYHPELFNKFGIICSTSVNKATIKRQAEYLAGRYSARLALQDFGIKKFYIKSDQNRSPIWPKGILGSISHSANRAYSAVSQDIHFNYIGVNYEQLIRPDIAKNIYSMIINDEEHRLLMESGFDFELALTIAFSVKESLFKALYPSIGKYFDFSAAKITHISKITHRIELKLSQSVAEKLIAGNCFNAWFYQGSTDVLTIIAM